MRWRPKRCPACRKPAEGECRHSVSQNRNGQRVYSLLPDRHTGEARACMPTTTKLIESLWSEWSLLGQRGHTCSSSTNIRHVPDPLIDHAINHGIGLGTAHAGSIYPNTDWVLNIMKKASLLCTGMISTRCQVPTAKVEAQHKVTVIWFLHMHPPL